MSGVVITDALVFTVYSWFQSAMKSVGRSIKFPRCSDQTKTYQFRNIKSFVNRCYNDLGLDEKTVRALVYDVVKYAKQKNLLSMGTRVLLMESVIDICVRTMKSMMDDEEALIRELISSRDFLLAQADSKDKPVRVLIEPSSSGMPNIMYWYNLGHLSDSFLALSKTCRKALTQIPIEHREELPSDVTLLRMCIHATSDTDILPKLQEVLGSDLRIPQVRS